MTAKKKYTIRDIAKEAGVSIATVSRLINNSGYIDTETKAKVEAVIHKYGYTPSRTAQSLKTSKSHQIMLIVPDIGNPFYSSMAKTIQGVCQKKGYVLTLYNTNESQEEEIKAVHAASSSGSDGIILCSIHVSEEVVATLQKKGIPSVLANSYGNCPFDTVHGRKGDGTYLATKHLLELGHRRIAFAGGYRGSETASRRRYGYEKALSELGLIVNEDYCFEMDFYEDSGYKAGRYFSSLSPLPTAICCANDLIALGVMAALNESGIRVPEDISITGMDDIPFTRILRPRLTTATNDSEKFGKAVTELLFDRIDDLYSGDPRVVIIPRELIVRESTRKVRSEAASDE